MCTHPAKYTFGLLHEVDFSWVKIVTDTNWLILPRQTMPPYLPMHGSTVTFKNIGLVAKTLKFNFAKKSNFKTGGLEYH